MAPGPASPLPPPSAEAPEPGAVPYSAADRILVIGDGNFSFSHALVTRLGAGGNVTATGYDTQAATDRKYGDAAAFLLACHRRGCRILFGVDATRLSCYEDFAGQCFDFIVFNFPHTGSQQHGVSNEQVLRSIRDNQRLLRKFLRHARSLVEPVGGEVHITLKRCQPYTDWDLPGQAAAAGMAVVRWFDFDPDLWPGYHHKATTGRKSSKVTMTAPVTFCLRPLLREAEEPTSTGGPSLLAEPYRVPSGSDVTGLGDAMGVAAAALHPVSFLNEFAAQRRLVFSLDLIWEAGPAHDKSFTFQSTLGEWATQGSGKSKDEAKRASAEAMVQLLTSAMAGPQDGGVDALEAAIPGPTAAPPRALTGEAPGLGDAVGVAAAALHPVSFLNEFAAQRRLVYSMDLIGEAGPDHDKRFTFQCTVGECATQG
eukprot:EG_transcript_13700